MSNITQKWVNLLIPFTTGYGQKFTESELARLSKIPQQTASRHINSLIKKNILNYEKQGKNKMIFLDISKQTTFTLLQTIENSKTLEFQQKEKEASLIINDMLKHSESIILFGSYAAFKPDKESDIDIVIIGKAEKEKIKSIKQKYNIEINEHYATYEEFAKSLKNKTPLAIEIIKNHILFGNTSKIVQTIMEAQT
jgi:predicted nucleotidyltransferase